MTSTFKLTSAEFKKIFKRPSIFIMAIMLVITILVSISIFNPSLPINSTVVYEGAETSLDYYNSFYKDENIDSKAFFDEDFLETDNVIKYYKAQNNNTTILTNYYNDVISAMNSIIDNANTDIKNEYRAGLNKSLSNFISAYKNLDAVKDFTDITSVALNNIQYKGETVSDTYYNSTACKPLTDFYKVVSDPNINDYSVVNSYLNNNYKSGLETVLENGINYVNTSITGLFIEFNNFYTKYIKTTGMADINELKNLRSNMLMVIETLDGYLATIGDYSHPVILMNNEKYRALNNKLDDAKLVLNISSTKDNVLNEHDTIKAQLSDIKLYETINNLIDDKSSKSPTFHQIHLPQTLVTKFEEQSTKVADNRTTILNSIDELKSDESINNISKSVTNYKLLANTYYNVILDNVLLHITDEYDANTYQGFYGYDFNEFNKYQYRERIALNTYYIANNVYSNSYQTNFSFSQNAGSSTSAYDFMYFTLELCTLIIIIFAMMLICNLITGETESGTIKLLLVRPFKRSKIITAKLLATIFFVITFMVFTSIITFVGGYFLYGLNTLPILGVFNSSIVFESSPLTLMIINILSLIMDVIFFVLLALMISIVFKNYAGSISACIVLIIMNLAFNMLFGGSFWYTLLPGMNLHMFKYFGNSFISTISGTSTLPGIIQSLLITGIHTSMSFVYSLFMYMAYSVVFLAVSYSVFKNRDF